MLKKSFVFENEVKQLTTQVSDKDDVNEKLQNDMDKMGDINNQNVKALEKQMANLEKEKEGLVVMLSEKR